eukprot:SAG22_NODE_213_length_15041_cov_3.683732_3_plen_80_part_00
MLGTAVQLQPVCNRTTIENATLVLPRRPPATLRSWLLVQGPMSVTLPSCSFGEATGCHSRGRHQHAFLFPRRRLDAVDD